MKQKRMITKLLALVACASILIVAVACKSSQNKNAGGQTETPGAVNTAPAVTPATTPTSGPAPSAPTSPQPIELASTTGQSVTQIVTLEKGSAVFKMTYTGTGRFAVSLASKAGKNLGSLVDTTQNFDGSKQIEIPEAGEYFVNITAAGPWNIKIEQPR